MFVEGTLPPLRSVENVSSAAKATVMVMVTDGLKAVPFNRFSSPWVGLRPISANLTWRLPKSEKTLVFWISKSPQSRHPESL